MVRGWIMQNALAELVTAHCDRTGDSLAAIAKRGGMSRQTLSALVNREGPMSWVRQSTLEALARGLDLPVESVRQVAAADAYAGNGDTPQPRTLVAALMAHAEGLTDAQLEVLLATATALKTHRAKA
jgi:transcriptional regulator with XRE-family HTH domain